MKIHKFFLSLSVLCIVGYSCEATFDEVDETGHRATTLKCAQASEIAESVVEAMKETVVTRFQKTHELNLWGTDDDYSCRPASSAQFIGSVQGITNGHIFIDESFDGRKLAKQGGYRVRFINIKCDRETSFAYSSFPCADFRNNNLSGISFDNGDFIGSDFRGCCLRGASFRGARVRGCDFTDADLADIQSDANTEWTYAKGLEAILLPQGRCIPLYLPAYIPPAASKMDPSQGRSCITSLCHLSKLNFQEERFNSLISRFAKELDVYREFQIPLFSADLSFILANRSAAFHRKALDTLRQLGVEEKKIDLINALSQGVGYGNMGLKIPVTGDPLGMQVYFQDYFGLAEVLRHKKPFESEGAAAKMADTCLKKVAEILDFRSNCIIGVDCIPGRPLTFETYFMLLDSSKAELSKLKEVFHLFSINESSFLPFLNIFQKTGQLILSFNALDIGKGLNLQITDANIGGMEEEMIALSSMLDEQGKEILRWVVQNQKAYGVTNNNIGMRVSQLSAPRLAWYLEF